MHFFAINLRDANGTIESLGFLEFDSLEDASADVRAAVPDMAATLARAGSDPFPYAFLICDADDHLLAEVPLGATLRAARDHPVPSESGRQA